MSLFSNCSIPEKFIISLINSLLIGHFIKNFVNNTVSFQINDARQLPIIIPNQNELEQIIELANKAIQEKQKGENDIFLNLIQQQVDEFVNNLYNLH